jgi:hypothetical protein
MYEVDRTATEGFIACLEQELGGSETFCFIVTPCLKVQTCAKLEGVVVLQGPLGNHF